VASNADRRRAQAPRAGRPAQKGHWLVKQEPGSYPFARLVADGTTSWTGVRNYQARNSLRQMKAGDLVLYYHSGDERAVAGVAKVVREAYPDPTAGTGDWVAVDIAAVEPLRAPVALATMKADSALRDIPFLRQSRLSVSPVGEKAFRRVLELGKKR
jgi:predicted RNA-binding protein with PUA-like domain